MLFRAYNLCDPGPDREQEIQTLRYAFINQDYPPKDVEQTISNYQECEGNEENKQAENRSEIDCCSIYQRHFRETTQRSGKAGC